MLLRQIIDAGLAQYVYLVGCKKTKQALVIDPERDIDRYLALADREGLEIVAPGTLRQRYPLDRRGSLPRPEGLPARLAY